MRSLFICFFFLVACTGQEQPLRFNLGVDVLELDWNRAIDSNSVTVLDNIMEGLSSYADSVQGARAEHYRPRPALAESWTIDEEGTRYLFKIRKKVYWTDGEELIAQHFVDSWQRLLSPKASMPNAYHFFGIVGARDYAEGKITDFTKVGIKALNDHELEVRLLYKIPYFLQLTAAPSSFPIRNDLILRNGSNWSNPQSIVTLGAYKISDWLQGEKLVLKANESYYDEAPKIREVICSFVYEPLTAYALYENDEIDILPKDLPSSYAQRILTHPDYRSGPRLAVNFLILNTKKPPFDSANNRRAFIEALDRNSLVQPFQITRVAFSGWIPPGMLGYDPNAGVKSISQKSDRMKNKSIQAFYSSADSWSLFFRDLKDSVEENLGLKVNLNAADQKEYSRFLAGLGRMRFGKKNNLPELFHLGWVADYPDPQSFMNIFTTDSESNFTGWSSAKYDDLVNQAVREDNEEKRAELYQAAQKVLLEEQVVVMPLFYSNHQVMVKPRVLGVHLNALDKWYFKKLYFDSNAWKQFSRSILLRMSPKRST
ncbi:MAG: peptide ABC transporter substrate-binding protein [Oligoflexia bacterium]|nr:peptide ABC transporter substrate-binding protein [Oligoflexia bacterium]